jgi:hypothetical protein
VARQGSPWWPIVPAVLVLIVVGLAWFVPGRALAVACALLAVSYLVPSARFGNLAGALPGPASPVAWTLLLFGALVLGRDRMPLAWLAILAVIAAVPIVEWFTPIVPYLPRIPISGYAAVLALLLLAWAVVDARPLAGLAIYAVVATAGTMVDQLRVQAGWVNLWTLFGWYPFTPTFIGMIVLPLAIWQVRRQSVL